MRTGAGIAGPSKMHNDLEISFRFNIHDSLRQRGQCDVGGLLFLQGRVEESGGIR